MKLKSTVVINFKDEIEELKNRHPKYVDLLDRLTPDDIYQGYKRWLEHNVTNENGIRILAIPRVVEGDEFDIFEYGNDQAYYVMIIKFTSEVFEFSCMDIDTEQNIQEKIILRSNISYDKRKDYIVGKRYNVGIVHK